MKQEEMQFACIHTHTVFCDGKDDVETCCRVAYNKGLRSLGFSAHAPIFAKTRFRSFWHLAEERLQEYFDAVRAAKKRWEGKLPVYLGLELDYIPGLMGPADKNYTEMGLDFIIGSVHYVIPPKGEPFTIDDSLERVTQGIKEGFGGDPMGMIELYFNSMEEMIRAGSFDLLAHPDLIKKNMTQIELQNNKLFSGDEDFYLKKFKALAALLAETGIPAELNTGGLNRGKTTDCYPSLAILKFFREHKIPMVINADAHKADDLDGHYEEARKAMLAAGYTETLLFEGRKNGRPVWNSVELSTRA